MERETAGEGRRPSMYDPARDIFSKKQQRESPSQRDGTDRVKTSSGDTSGNLSSPTDPGSQNRNIPVSKEGTPLKPQAISDDF